MARKRGRPSKPSSNRKDAHLSVRLRADLKERLKKDAASAGLSLSEEHARVLGEHYASKIAEAGSPATYRFAHRIAHALLILNEITNRWWYEDRFTFDAAQIAIQYLLEAVRPPQKHGRDAEAEAIGSGVARQILMGMAFLGNRETTKALNTVLLGSREFQKIKAELDSKPSITPATREWLAKIEKTISISGKHAAAIAHRGGIPTGIEKDTDLTASIEDISRLSERLNRSGKSKRAGK